MASLTVRSEDIRGLIPVIDSKKKSGYNIVSGKNFAFDIDGPISSFGNSFLTDIPEEGVDGAQSIIADTPNGPQNYWALDGRIVQWNEALGGFVPIFIIPSTLTTPYRWTTGTVNLVTFFCHPAIGVLFFGVQTGIIGILDLSGTLEDGESVQAITESNGRLNLITKTRFINSSQDNGFDYDFAVVGGATFLRLSAQVAGAGFMIASYGQGVLSFTTGGIMRSQFVGGQEVYQHRSLRGKFVPINSFCVSLNVQEAVVFLDKRGVYSSAGDIPQPLTPIFNEFLLAEIKRGTFKFNNNLRIEWGVDNQQFYILFAESDQTGIYDYAYTLNSTLDKWGSFNERHYGLGPILIDSGDRRGEFTGFVGEDKKFRVWELASSRKDTTINTSAYQFDQLFQSPRELDSDATSIKVGSTMRLSSLSEAVFGGISGHYTFDAGVLAVPTLLGLDSNIRVGLLRFQIGQYPDELSEMQQYAVSSSVGESVDADNEDWDAVPSGTSDEDWNIEIGQVDWGFAPKTVVNFDFTAIGTIDGQTQFSAVTPKFQQVEPAVRFYWGQVIGLWNIIELAANTVGQFYHLRQIEVNGIPAGRLS